MAEPLMPIEMANRLRAWANDHLHDPDVRDGSDCPVCVAREAADKLDHLEEIYRNGY